MTEDHNRYAPSIFDDIISIIRTEDPLETLSMYEKFHNTELQDEYYFFLGSKMESEDLTVKNRVIRFDISNEDNMILYGAYTIGWMQNIGHMGRLILLHIDFMRKSAKVTLELESERLKRARLYGIYRRVAKYMFSLRKLKTPQNL